MSIYHHPWFMFSHLCGILEYPYLAVWWFYAAFGKRGKSFVATIFRVETNDLGWHIPTKWRQIFTIGPFQPACTCTLLNLQKKQQKKIWFENWIARQIPVKHTLDGVGGWRPQYQLSIRSPRWWLMTSISARPLSPPQVMWRLDSLSRRASIRPRGLASEGCSSFWFHWKWFCF